MAAPLIKGTVRLSLMGEGRHSTSIPTVAPIRALIGFTKHTAPRKAKMKPKREPSKCLVLLNENCFLPSFPNNDAHPSPNVSTAIDAYPICSGKIMIESIMPKA